MRKILKPLMALTMAATMLLGAQSVMASEEEGTIYILHNQGEGAFTDALGRAIAKVNEQYPNITVEQQTSSGEYYSTLKTKANAGEVPDVFLTNGYKDIEVYKDFMYDLTDDAEFAAAYESLFDSIKASVVGSDGKLYGLPVAYQGHGYIYNKDLFEQAGIEKLPETYEEMVAVCEQLVENGITPFVNGYSEWWLWRFQLSTFFAAQFDDYAEMRDQITDGTITFADLEYIDEMFQWADLNLEYGVDKQLETTFDVATSKFANGEAAMYYNGDWESAAILAANPDINMGYIPIPVGDSTYFMADITNTFSISKDTEHYEVAKALLLALVEVLQTEGNGQDLMPTKGIDAAAVVGDNVLVHETVAATEAGIAHAYPNYFWPEGFEQEFGVLMQEYASGALTKEETIDEMQKTWEKLAK